MAQTLTELLWGSNPCKMKGKKWVNNKWPWGEAQDNAFRAVVHQLTQLHILCKPDFSKPFIARSDASKQGLGAVLCQEQQSGDVRVVWYGSSTLRKAEKNYGTHKLEFLALLSCYQTFASLIIWSTTFHCDYGSQSPHLSTDVSQAGCNGTEMAGWTGPL